MLLPQIEQVGVGEGHVAQPDARLVVGRSLHGTEYRRSDPRPGPPARATDPGHEPAAPRRRRPAADRPFVGEPRRAPDPRGDGWRRVRGPALPGREAADRGRRRGRRVGDGPPDAPQRRAAPPWIESDKEARRLLGDPRRVDRAGAADGAPCRASGCVAITCRLCGP